MTEWTVEWLAFDLERRTGHPREACRRLVLVYGCERLWAALRWSGNSRDRSRLRRA